MRPSLKSLGDVLFVFGVLLIVSVALAGCRSGTDASHINRSTDHAVEVVVTSETPEDMLPTKTSTVVLPAPTPTDALPSATAMATYPATEALPTPRSGLEATDPATVEIASGQLQLVEFFAFW